MYRISILLISSLLLMPAGMLAHSGGGGMGFMNGTGGPGMLVIADDGSLLVVEMDVSGTPGGGPGSMELDRELVNIAPDGTERWRASFDEGWPMMAVTDGDLVVFALVEDWWMGYGNSGDHGWGGGPGGHHGDDPHQDQTTLVALDLTDGTELWRTELEGDMASPVQFAPDGSRLYVTVRDLEGDDLGGDPMHQGDTPSHMLMSTTVTALDRSGNVLWQLQLGDGMGGPPGGGGR